jgi:Na+-translocating ferredoxin:NAD+ oxidoreductase RnfA subunit
MVLNLPKKTTFWISVAIAAVGVIVEAVHLIVKDSIFLGGISFILVIAAFVLLCLGLTLKGL